MNKPHLWLAPAGKCLSETRRELLHLRSIKGEKKGIDLEIKFLNKEMNLKFF